MPWLHNFSLEIISSPKSIFYYINFKCYCNNKKIENYSNIEISICPQMKVISKFLSIIFIEQNNLFTSLNGDLKKLRPLKRKEININ